MKVTTWKINLANNYREVIYSRDKNFVIEEEDGKGKLLFTNVNGVKEFIVTLIDEKSFCFTPVHSDILDKDDFNANSQYVCLVEIPPDDNIILGFMVVSYAHVPEQAEVMRKRLEVIKDPNVYFVSYIKNIEYSDSYDEYSKITSSY